MRWYHVAIVVHANTYLVIVHLGLLSHMIIASRTLPLRIVVTWDYCTWDDYQIGITMYDYCHVIPSHEGPLPRRCYHIGPLPRGTIACRTIATLDYCHVGLLSRWTIATLDYCHVGLLSRWTGAT